ncbi:50S ribosomal protein L32 [Actinocorallia longicatena]|uniref:Large ribosomal subunit protein bL32 n=1 Tax=Actinocorallia longicatena TaxID=111803 RepID=A0ABP6Q1U1_9ACTN
MAVPKRKKSRSNTRHRRSSWKTQAVALVECPQCRDPKQPHIACPTCGVYNKRQVVETA